MTDHDDSETRGGIPHAVNDLIAQLRAVTEKLAGLTGLIGLTGSLPGMHALPRPNAADLGG